MVHRPVEYEALRNVERYLFSRRIAHRIGDAHRTCQKHEITFMQTTRFAHLEDTARLNFIAHKTGFTPEHVGKLLLELTVYMLGVS